MKDLFDKLYQKALEFNMMEPSLKKCNLKSNGFLEEALNSLEFDEMIMLYKRAIQSAPTDSDNIYFAYRKCAQTFLFYDKFEDCLNAIQLAMPICPTDKLHELKKIEQKYLQKKSAMMPEIKSNETQLSYQPNEDNPSFAYCLKPVEGSLSGIKTTRDLRPGDIIAIEKVLSSKLLHCDNINCHTSIEPLIPCDGCTQVIYCTKDCRKEAFELYHKFECKHNFTIKTLLCVRLALLAIKKLDYSDLIKFNNNGHSLFGTISYKEYTIPIDSKIDRYCLFLRNTFHISKAVFKTGNEYDLVHIMDNPDVDDLFILGLIHLFKKETAFICKFIYFKYKYNRIYNELFNFTSYIIPAESGENVLINFVGSATELFGSSSQPNIRFRSIESKNVVVEVVKPIKEGSELLVAKGILKRMANIFDISLLT